jgi:CRISPR-associated protein Cas5t
VTLWLRLRAPFAAYRGIQAGVYRPSAPVIPPSAAWGLVLNLAGIETRTPGVLSGVDPLAPTLRLAVGSVHFPGRGSLYQQLHGYPVGKSGERDLAPRTHGAKYWIAPARRELLIDLDCVVGIQGDEGVLDRVTRGLRGELNEGRYGVPFAGDNNYLFDAIEAVQAPPPTHWYVRVGAGKSPGRKSCRLMVEPNREESGRTTFVLAAPLEQAVVVPPEGAWVWTPRDPGA